MSLVNSIDEYFRAERNLGLAMTFGAMLLAVMSAWVWRTQSGAFGSSLLAVLLFGAVAFGGGGVFLAPRSERQRVDFAAQAAGDPRALVAAEMPRMQKVAQLWPRAKAAWSWLMLVALVLIMLVRHEAAHGVGLGLLVLLTALFFTDVFGERRARLYTEALINAGATASPE